VARRFAEAAEQVTTKVGRAVEHAFDQTAEHLQRHPDVGERVASAIEQAIESVGQAIPKRDPGAEQLKRDRKLLQRRDQVNTRMLLFAALGVGMAGLALFGGTDAWSGASIAAAVFGILFARNALWKGHNRTAVQQAERRLETDPGDRVRDTTPVGRVKEAEPTDPTAGPEIDPETGTPSDAPDTPPSLLVHNQTVGVEEVGAVELEARQILRLLDEMGEERAAIRQSVDTAVSKARELGARRARLEEILSDPDLSSLDERIEDLDERIGETEDPETRDVYDHTLQQLRIQAESIADIRVMQTRVDAYLNASLQSLRTIHIDLLRLQTGDLSDPDGTLREVSARASNLSLEIKGVREVVEEVQNARRAAAAQRSRQL